MSAFQETKIWLVDSLGLSKDALHIYVGLAVFLLSALLFRWRLSDWRPLLAVAAAALAGEAWDIYDTSVLGAPQVYAGNAHDLWNTLFWPAALFVLARWSRLELR